MAIFRSLFCFIYSQRGFLLIILLPTNLRSSFFMHILEIPSFFPPYGGEFCLEQSKALQQLGHEVRILSHVQLGITKGWKDYLFLPYTLDVETMDGVEVWRDFQRGIPKAVRPNVDRWLKGVLKLSEEYFRQYGCPDVIHAHCVKWAGRAAMLIAQHHRIPYVITEHLPSMIYEEEFRRASLGQWEIPLLREALEKADRVVVVSEELVDDLAPYFGKRYSHQVVSNMIDTRFFHYTKRQPSDTFRFCAIGNFIPRKGYDILAEAFRRLKSQGVNASLTLVGPDTDSASCRRLYANIPDVRFVGTTDKVGVRDILYSADALVLPTRSESQGLVLLEAMSTGIPVITTDVVPQSVRQHDGCVTVPTEDAVSLSHAMVRLISEYFSSEHISSAISECYSSHIIGNQLQQLFFSLLERQVKQ